MLAPMPTHAAVSETSPSQSDWFEASLAGNLKLAEELQYQIRIATTDNVKAVVSNQAMPWPLVHASAPPCPGFERLDAIMSAPQPTCKCLWTDCERDHS